MSKIQTVARRTIPLAGIVLILGGLGCNNFVAGVHLPSGPKANTHDSYAIGDQQQQQLISVVQDFLKQVPSGDPAVFKKFFADDVIYTRASGLEIGKSDVLARTGGSQAGDPNVTFTGEDFIVHPYGNFAVVNFRLVMHANKDGKETTQSFRNTGTFMKRNGEWQAIAWQATPIAEK